MGWIRDLEMVLLNRSLGREVERLRSTWGQQVDLGVKTHDPLATLATAAMASQPPQPHVRPPVRPPSASSWEGNEAYPYPTPDLPQDQHMPQAQYWQEDRKRKRHEGHFPVRPHGPPHHHQAEVLPPIRMSQSLPPLHAQHIQPILAPRDSTARPTPSTASHSHSIGSSQSLSQYHYEGSSPKRLQISNLLSPAAPASPTMHSVDVISEGDRRWSSGDLSVIDHSLSYPDLARRNSGEQGRHSVTSLTGWSFPPHTSLSSSSSSHYPPSIPPSIPSSVHYAPSYTPTHPRHSISADQIVAPYGTSPYSTLPETFTRGIHQGYPTFAHPPIDDSHLLPAPSIPLDVNVPRIDLHPAILACRSLLLSLLPTPLPFRLPPLPPLEPAHQKLLLLALTALVPQADQSMFHQRQLKFIPAEDAKRLLQYQSEPTTADARLILFPIAIMRAKIVQALQTGREPDITRFINDTLCHARIFGATLDPDAWEMPTEYWDVWESWIPRGKAYCHSLSKWRRRDGHRGASVLEMILGMEKDHSRRTDPVGKPPNWTF